MRIAIIIIFVCATIMLVLGLISAFTGKGAPAWQTLAPAAALFGVGTALQVTQSSKGRHRAR